MSTNRADPVAMKPRFYVQDAGGHWYRNRMPDLHGPFLLTEATTLPSKYSTWLLA